MKYKTYPKMKDSEIEWIGDIPEHWEMRKIKNSELLILSQGSSVNFSDIGKYPVYGSNGQIGFYNEYNVENTILIGRVGAYAGSIFHWKFVGGLKSFFLSIVFLEI